jgi:hypothetical protein
MYDTVHVGRLATSMEWFVKRQKPKVLATVGDTDPEAPSAVYIPRGSSVEKMRPIAEAPRHLHKGGLYHHPGQVFEQFRTTTDNR